MEKIIHIDKKIGEDEDFAKFVDNNFEEFWFDIEDETVKLDKKQLSKKMFILGYVMCRETINNLISKMELDYVKDPLKFERMLKESSSKTKQTV